MARCRRFLAAQASDLPLGPEGDVPHPMQAGFRCANCCSHWQSSNKRSCGRATFLMESGDRITQHPPENPRSSQHRRTAVHPVHPGGLQVTTSLPLPHWASQSARPVQVRVVPRPQTSRTGCSARSAGTATKWTGSAHVNARRVQRSAGTCPAGFAPLWPLLITVGSTMYRVRRVATEGVTDNVQSSPERDRPGRGVTSMMPSDKAPADHATKLPAILHQLSCNRSSVRTTTPVVKRQLTQYCLGCRLTSPSRFCTGAATLGHNRPATGWPRRGRDTRWLHWQARLRESPAESGRGQPDRRRAPMVYPATARAIRATPLQRRPHPLPAGDPVGRVRYMLGSDFLG